MALKLKLDANNVAVLLDGKPVYVDDDGKEIAYDANQTVATIARLNGEAKSHRERAEKAEGDLKAFDGLDAAAARKALKDVGNWDEKQKAAAGERDKAISEAVKAVEEKYAPIQKQRDELLSQLDAHVIGTAFNGSKFIAEKFQAQGPAGVEIARALFSSRFKVENGKAVGYDAQGNKLYSRTKPGELADSNEAIELMVDAYAHKDSILKGDVKSGGGANPGGGGGGGGKKTMARTAFDSLDPKGKSDFMAAGGTLT